MAIVERGKGKRSQKFEIARSGLLLRSQESSAGDVRLPGYRRFSIEAAAAATAALEAEVQAHLKDGMQPADDEARAIAARIKPATFPVRCDLGITTRPPASSSRREKWRARNLTKARPIGQKQ